MEKHPTEDRRRKLERLLAGLLDGIDGYESECGDLGPFWREDLVNEARAYFSTLPDGGKAAGYWLARG